MLAMASNGNKNRAIQLIIDLIDYKMLEAKENIWSNITQLANAIIYSSVRR